MKKLFSRISGLVLSLAILTTSSCFAADPKKYDGADDKMQRGFMSLIQKYPDHAQLINSFHDTYEKLKNDNVEKDFEEFKNNNPEEFEPLCVASDFVSKRWLARQKFIYLGQALSKVIPIDKIDVNDPCQLEIFAIFYNTTVENAREILQKIKAK